MRVSWGALVVVPIVVGCGATVEPHVRAFYPAAHRGTDRAIRGEVLVGEPFVLAGDFHATCKERPIFPKYEEDDRTTYSACKHERTSLVVRCEGACRVDGAQVTPTAPGPLTVTIELTAKGRHATKTLSLVAVDATELELSSCMGGSGVIAGRGESCLTPRGVVGLVALGREDKYDVPVEFAVRGRRGVGAILDLGALLAGSPGSTGVARGAYEVELRYRDLVRVVTIEILDDP